MAERRQISIQCFFWAGTVPHPVDIHFYPICGKKAWTNQCPVRGRTKLVWMITPERSFTPNASGEPDIHFFDFFWVEKVIRQLRIKTIQNPRLTGTSVFSTFFCCEGLADISRPCLMFENRGPCTVLRFKAKQVRFGMYCRAHLLRMPGWFVWSWNHRFAGPYMGFPKSWR